MISNSGIAKMIVIIQPISAIIRLMFFMVVCIPTISNFSSSILFVTFKSISCCFSSNVSIFSLIS